MKHEREIENGMTSLNTKRRRIKLVEKLPIVAELGKLNEEEWAKKAGLVSLEKFDWTHINEPLMKELICNFNYENWYVKLERWHINIGEEGIAELFKLPCGGLMVGAQERHNGVATTYFTRTQQDH
jgi:hypothetical protein